MYKEQVGDSYGMKDLFISLSKREGKWETTVYKQTTLVKVQVVYFILQPIKEMITCTALRCVTS